VNLTSTGPAAAGQTAQGARPMVEAVEVCKGFGGTPVLTGVSFTVDPGTVTCLIGPSGGGKSTLLRCINHLEPVDSGQVYVDGQLVGYREAKGHRLRALSRREVAAHRADVGMVFQLFNLFPHMTALQNVIEAPIHVRREPRSQAIEHATALLERVGLGAKIASYPRQLSGGQQQRVAIARALAMRPKVMLFDEPTSALDPELVGEVLDVMRSLAADGLTMIVATHEIGFAREVAGQVIFLANGTIVEGGPGRQVLDAPREERTRQFLSALGGPRPGQEGAK
jgi:polar amino acid transport system ATP-binding protein